MTSRGMTEGPGERAEKSRSNRFWGLMGGFMLLGGVIGAALVLLERDGGLPGWAAIGIVVLLVVGLGGGSWYFYRRIDEVERSANLWGAAVALHFYLIGYASWYFLWKGALVPEPDHEALYIATLIVMTLAYLWKKVRP